MTLLLAVGLRLSTLLSQTVILDTVDSVGGIVDRVSKATGYRMAVDSDVSFITAYARMNGVSVDEFQRRMAEMTRSSWILVNGVSTLKRTAEQSRKLEQDRIAALTPSLSKELAELRPGLEGETTQQAGKLFAKSLRTHLTTPSPKSFYGPTDGLLQEILRLMGTNILASLPRNQISLFSNRPTAPESGLPDLSALISKYKEVSLAFSKDASGESMQGVVDDYDFNRLISAARRVESMDRMVLWVYPGFRGTATTLTVYDAQGQILSDSAIALHAVAAPPTTQVPIPDHKIEWPGQTAATLASLKGAAPTPGQDELIKTLLQEPLELQAMPGLRSIAVEPMVSILCPLPDSVAVELIQGRPQSEQTFADALAAQGVSLRIDGEWLTGQLSATCFGSSRFLSRRALRTWVSASISNSYTWLRRTATLYGQAGDAVSSGLVGWIKQLVWPILKITEPEQLTPRWALFALGSLSDPEWRALDQGRPVSCAGQADRLKQVEQWSWSSNEVLERIDGSLGPDTEKIGSFSFPGGPPEATTISLSQVNQRLFADSRQDSYWLNLDQMANRACMLPPHAGTEDAALKALTGRFRIGVRSDVLIEIRLGSRFCLRCSQPGTDVSEKTDPLAVADWPADILQDLRAAIRTFLATRGSAGVIVPPPAQ